MITFELFGFLIDWTNFGLQISLASITYPFGDKFRTDSLFVMSYIDGELFLELFYMVIIGEKR
jgi:hypothetical protein